MFGLKLPVIAAAGALGVLAVGGVTGLPKQALADEGGGGSSSSSSSASSSASSGSGMDISPATVAPGGVVSLHLKASCKSGDKAKASAEVFVDAVTLSPSGGGSDGWDGTAFIKSDAVDGSYTVSVECNGSSSSASATVTVTTGGGAPPAPVNPVPAGGGGTAQLAAGPAAAGTSTGPLLATGGVAAAGLAGLVLHRRRSAARG
ncbi:hypothetical protein [Streptomyces sp. NPDC049040]|uniref:hypothetical protein n=1 Tax=Streptomyces sp. NPDC049040 TaxID=3365593 RepID=UPI0037133B75